MRRAAVTGAAGGIGSAVAQVLADRGYDVLVTDRDLAGATEVAAAIRHSGGRAQPARLDVRDSRQRAEVVALVRDYGLDVLVHCAGILDATPTDGLDAARLTTVLEIDLVGVIASTLDLIPVLRCGTDPRIVTVTSVHAGRTTRDTLAYATAKGGLDAFTRALALDLAPDGVLVNAVAPGFVDTGMALLENGIKEYQTDWFRDIYLRHGRLPLGRPAQPREVAELVQFLVSPTNTYVTGQVVTVDGGLSAAL